MGLVGSCKVLTMSLDTYAGFSINTKKVLLDTLTQQWRKAGVSPPCWLGGCEPGVTLQTPVHTWEVTPGKKPPKYHKIAI